MYVHQPAFEACLYILRRACLSRGGPSSFHSKPSNENPNLNSGTEVLPAGVRDASYGLIRVLGTGAKV